MSRLTKYELPFNLKTAKALGVSRSPKALDVRYWHKADIGCGWLISAFGGKADILFVHRPRRIGSAWVEKEQVRSPLVYTVRKIEIPKVP